MKDETHAVLRQMPVVGQHAQRQPALATRTLTPQRPVSATRTPTSAAEVLNPTARLATAPPRAPVLTMQQKASSYAPVPVPKTGSASLVLFPPDACHEDAKPGGGSGEARARLFFKPFPSYRRGPGDATGAPAAGDGVQLLARSKGRVDHQRDRCGLAGKGRKRFCFSCRKGC